MGCARQLLMVWAVLMGLLLATVGASFILSGPASLAASLGIALAKAALIFWFFMNLRREGGLVRLAAVGAVAWLGVLFVLSFLDYLTR